MIAEVSVHAGSISICNSSGVILRDFFCDRMINSQVEKKIFKDSILRSLNIEVNFFSVNSQFLALNKDWFPWEVQAKIHILTLSKSIEANFDEDFTGTFSSSKLFKFNPNNKHILADSGLFTNAADPVRPDQLCRMRLRKSVAVGFQIFF